MAIFNMGMTAAVVAQGIHQGSKAALIMGGVIGSLFATTAYLVSTQRAQIGFGLGALTSVALCGRMSQYVITSKQYNSPRGYMAALSAIACIYNTSKFMSLPKE